MPSTCLSLEKTCLPQCVSATVQVIQGQVDCCAEPINPGLSALC
jgi:hypothetical protein